MATGRNLGFDVNPIGTSVFVVQVVFLVLAWTTSLTRAFVKLVLLKNVTVDDYTMLLSLFGYTATAYFVISAIVEGGLGSSNKLLTWGDTAISLRSLFMNMVLSGPVSGLARISVSLFLLRIALKKWHRVVLHVIIGVTTVMTVAYFFIILFQCSPPSFFWERAVLRGPGGPSGGLGGPPGGSPGGGPVSGSCTDGSVSRYATLVWGSFAAAMDWTLGLLPIPILWHVRINRQSKIGIAAILSFGIIAGIALIVRLAYIQSTSLASKDSERVAPAVSITAIVELSLGIIAGCIATFPPLFKRMGIHLGGTTKRTPVVDTLPWQQSFAETEPRHRGAESIIMTSPRRLRNSKLLQGGVAVEVQRLRAKSPSAKRVLSSSNWEIDIERSDLEGDDQVVPPPDKGIQVRTFIRVDSQPSSGNFSVSTVDFADKDKPLPPPPLREVSRDRSRNRSIPNSRPDTPNTFL